MSQAAAQASAFYREVARSRRLWAIKDASGFPAPETSLGRSMPFWSSLARAERMIESIQAYGGFSTVEISWDEFQSRWLPGLERDGLRVGVNWTGAQATGYDLMPAELRANVEHAIASLAAESEQTEMLRFMPWPFAAGVFPRELGAVVQRSVLDGTRPALYVVHSDESDWAIGDGIDDPNEPGACVATHIWHAIEQNPSIAHLTHLAPGYQARRRSPTESWVVTREETPD